MSVIKSYDINKYNFCNEIEQIFNVEAGELVNLHIHRRDLMPDHELNFENEVRTGFHSTFYGALNSDKGDSIKGVFENFVSDIIAPLFKRSFVYQKFPSFRVHIPNNQAVHKWHYDSDENHKHPEWEINFQITATKMWDTNAMWLESVPGLGDFKPVEMDVGDFAIFYGNKCAHGNKQNETNKTRVSMDFRVIPYDKYNESSNLSSSVVGTNTKFAIEHYYNLFEYTGD